MQKRTLGRRAFIGGIATTGMISGLASEGQAFTSYDDRRVALDSVLDTSKALAGYDAGMLSIAERIGPVYLTVEEESRHVYHPNIHVFEFERLNPDMPVRYGHVRPVLKIIEVIDEELAVSLPNYRLLNAYSAGARLTTVGGILQACRAIGRNSVEIAAIDRDPDRAISDEHRISFGIALLALAAELAFAVVPINFRFAWRTTRIAANRGLYQLRRLPAGNQLQAITMSFVHWIVRDVPERFVEYLLSPENLRAIWDGLQTRLQEVGTDELETMSRQEFERALVEFTATKLDQDIGDELPRV